MWTIQITKWPPNARDTNEYENGKIENRKRQSNERKNKNCPIEELGKFLVSSHRQHWEPATLCLSSLPNNRCVIRPYGLVELTKVFHFFIRFLHRRREKTKMQLWLSTFCCRFWRACCCSKQNSGHKQIRFIFNFIMRIVCVFFFWFFLLFNSEGK